MKKQRILSLLLAFAMVFSLLPASAMAVKAETFDDISKDDWYYKYVDFVTDKEYFVGTSKTTFSPEMSMTRAMFVVVLAALEGVKVDNNVSPFADVPANTWYSGAVKWAADKGVVAGIGDNKFAPDTAISREQMAVMMKAYVEWHSDKTGETHKLKSKIKAFNDAAKISSWAEKSTEDCRKWGLIAGAPDGNFYPQNTATRAEVATVIYNLAWLITGGSIGGGGGGGGHTCVDADKDHKCDYCGTAMGGSCADGNNDHKCDYCGTKLSDCADANNDHNCDVCGTKLSDCADANNDHNCDVCGTKLSDCADADNDHNCDVCGTKLSDCADADNDHNCDVCGTKLSDCADANNDHNCDVCGTKLSDCADTNNDHKCDVCGAAMCPGEDLIFNAMVNSVKEIKAGLKDQGKLVTDKTKLDEAALAVLKKSGALKLLDYGLENGEGFITYGGNDTFATITAVELAKNKCVVCGGGSDTHTNKVDTILSLNKSTAKDIIDATGLTYELAIDAAKALLAGAGYAVTALDKEDAIAIANALADKFEAETGIPVSKETVKKAIDKLQKAPAYIKETVKDAASAAEANARDVWTGNFKNENGYVTGDITFTVGESNTKVVVHVDDETYLEGSKKDAIVNVALAIAKDLYGDLKENSSNWATLPEITANEAFGFEATVAFSEPQNDNAEKTNCFAYTYPVKFTFTAQGDAFNYVQYKYDGIHNVKFIVPEKVQELYSAAASKLVNTVLVPVLSSKLQDKMSGLNFGSPAMAVMALDAEPAAEIPTFNLDALMKDAVDAWLSQNLTTGDISTSTLLGVVNGTVSADKLNNDAIYDLIDTTLDSNLASMLDGILDPGDADAVSLAGDPEALDTLLQDALSEKDYNKLQDMGLVDYTIAKTQEYLDPEYTNNGGVKYTEQTTNAAGEVVKPAEQMKEAVSDVVADTIDKTFNPAVESTESKLYKKALNAVGALSSVEYMTNVELADVADILTNSTFQKYINGRGDSVVARICDLVAYVPESASVSIGSYTVAEDDLAALVAANTTVKACNAVAGILDNMGKLSLASFAGDGLDISVAFAGKSVTFGLAIEF